MKTAFVFAALALAAACGKGDGSQKDDPMDPVGLTERYADEMCACKDIDCVTRVATAQGERVKAYEAARGPMPTAEQVTKMQAAQRRQSGCLRALMDKPAR